jgi:hypothetical protein
MVQFDFNLPKMRTPNGHLGAPSGMRRVALRGKRLGVLSLAVLACQVLQAQSPCATPSPISATNATICVGGASLLNATSTGNTINWYNVPSGGSILGNTPSGSNFSVSPATTTTYYGEAIGGAASGSQTFNFTGGMQTFTVPSGITSINITAFGGQGASAADVYTPSGVGGLGGSATGTLTVTPGQVLEVYVGGQGSTGGTGGYNGGGAGGSSSAGGGCVGGAAGGGGGASDVRAGGSALSNRVIVGAGGGGAGRDYCNGSCVPCGCGGTGGGAGGLTGGNGSAAINCGFSYPGSGINFGGGATGGGAGAGGTGDGGGPAGNSGAANVGGAGAAGSYDVSGGGGGGGFFGGGGGGGASSGSGVGGGGGGGGSSFIGGVTSGSSASGVRTGNGQVVISWTGTACITSPRVPVTVTVVGDPSISVSGGTTICSGTTATLSASTGGGTGTCTIQWQASANNVTFANIPGANSANYTTPALTATTYFRAVWSCTGTDCNTATSVSQTVTVADNVAPVITCPGNQSVNTSSGCTAAVNYTTPVGTDNCPGATTARTAGLASGAAFPIGNTTVTFVVSAANGATSSCSFIVTVTDVTPPTAICQNVTLTLDNSGNATLVPSSVNNGSSDNCPGLTFSASQTAFTCPLGTTIPVTLTVSDNSGNNSTCTANVTTVDNTAPIAVCASQTVYLDANGVGTASDASANGGSTDACGIISALLGNTSYTCVDLGTVNEVLTVTDVNNNSSTCTAIVEVMDSIAPVVVCQNITVQLDSAGNASITVGDIDNGSTDNCGINAATVSISTFTCANAGANTVTVQMDDLSGNLSSCTATVTVLSIPVLATASVDSAQCGYNVSCNLGNDGVAHAFGSGGCPGAYSFLWSNGDTSSTASGLICRHLHCDHHRCRWCNRGGYCGGHRTQCIGCELQPHQPMLRRFDWRDRHQPCGRQ